MGAPCSCGNDYPEWAPCICHRLWLAHSWRLEPAAIDRAATLQRDLLAAAAGRVRPGGLLAYSVCTLTREETLDVDDWASATFPEFTALDRPGGPWRPHGRGALLLPTAAGTDGMFLLLLRAPS